MALSVVIPTLNEVENLESLLLRLDATLAKELTPYEVICIDDNSSDGTFELGKQLEHRYPFSIYHKKGKKGKAFSLIEGFALANFENIAMIDADLQYPPEALPDMLEKLQGADIVVANRSQRHEPFVRRGSSFAFQLVFSRFLHGVKVDAQSGLKVFKKSVLDAIELNPSPWTFDLEFLIKAEGEGFVTDSVAINFAPRTAGISKIRLGSAAIEIATSSIGLKRRMRSDTHVNRDESTADTENGLIYKGKEFTTYSDLHRSLSAVERFSSTQLLSLALIALVFIVSLLFSWQHTVAALIATATGLYFMDMVFNGMLIKRSLFDASEIKVAPARMRVRQEWPMYTIFCPLYKETAVLPQFVEAMRKLDYPEDKLDIQLLLEEGDSETIEAANAMDLPDHFTVYVVPESEPKTKPKACNYGLLHARGEYAVIYDAEDIPEPNQLKKAVIAFDDADETVACIQAKLNYYNWEQNLLTRLFTLEYSLWFDLILPGLQSFDAPIPLGGTSNHFPVAVLKKLGGWDPFNVTEDADLGMRLSKLGYKTAILDSTTMEEANSSFFNWLKQRSRWVKGYMQTYWVHMRKSPHDTSGSSVSDTVFLQIVVGGKALSMLVNPLLWSLTLTYWLGGESVRTAIESLYVAPVYYLGMVTLILGNFFYLYYYMIGAAKRQQWQILPYGIFVPFYWLMMSVAAYYALYELIVKPFYWQKTTHGLHLRNEQFASVPVQTGEGS